MLPCFSRNSRPLTRAELLTLIEILLIGLSQKSCAYFDLKADFVPPYDPLKFPNKWRKMNPDWPARTLLAHLGKDSYTHIHYDNRQARTLSVREAARLQSFPDGFQFSGSMNPGFRQIGNAVPPLMSAALAESIQSCLQTMPGASPREATVSPRQHPLKQSSTA